MVDLPDQPRCVHRQLGPHTFCIHNEVEATCQFWLRCPGPLLVDTEQPASDETLQRRLFNECETAGWDPEKRNSFAEECAHLHEEVSEAFREWRMHKDFETRATCQRCGRSVLIADLTHHIRHPETLHHYTPDGNNCHGLFKPTGIPIELADVLIGLFYNAELHGFDLLQAVEIKHEWNLRRNYQTEGRTLHPVIEEAGGV